MTRAPWFAAYMMPAAIMADLAVPAAFTWYRPSRRGRYRGYDGRHSNCGQHPPDHYDHRLPEARRSGQDPHSWTISATMVIASPLNNETLWHGCHRHTSK